AETVEHVLTLAGDPARLVPDLSPPPPPTQRQQQCRGGCRRGNLADRIAAYMPRLPNLALGQGRDDVAFHFAAFLARDLDLADDLALEWLECWDAGNSPPKGRERLAEIIANARRYGQRPFGCGRQREDVPVPGKPVVIPGRRPGHFILRCQLEVD